MFRDDNNSDLSSDMGMEDKKDFNSKTVDELMPEYINDEPLEYKVPRKK